MLFPLTLLPVVCLLSICDTDPAGADDQKQDMPGVQ
jgi:hypothetical protein